MNQITTTALYTREELHDILGRATFAHAQDAGLYAVGDKYLGQAVLDALARAHDNVASQHAAQKGEDTHETRQVAAHSKTARPDRPSVSNSATDVLRRLEKDAA